MRPCLPTLFMPTRRQVHMAAPIPAAERTTKWRIARSHPVHEALHVFDSVIAQEPHHVLALNNKGVILYGLGRYAEAEQIFFEALSQDNNNVSNVINLISMYIDKYDIKNAEDVLIKYGNYLSTQDIHELKEILYDIQKKIIMFIHLKRQKLPTSLWI